jgi:hypothetical protein
MNRDAKLYFVIDKNWEPLRELILANGYGAIQNDISIFEIVPESQHHHYAVISVSDKADTIIEQYGGHLAAEHDFVIHELKQGNRVPLFGEKSLAAFLNWQ